MEKKIKNLKTLLFWVLSLLTFLIVSSTTVLISFYIDIKTIRQDIREITETSSEVRVMCGNYYDWEVIETVDGNVWQIDKEFEEGQLLQVMFNTKGTTTVVDDEIINIKEVK